LSLALLLKRHLLLETILAGGNQETALGKVLVVVVEQHWASSETAAIARERFGSQWSAQ